jgi:ABC-type amino acid transport substrate-binding protein
MTTAHLPKAVLLAMNVALAGSVWAQVPALSPNLPFLSACAGETAPFVIIKGLVTPTGYSISLFNHIAEQLQRRANFKELPWARCLEDVKAGRIDLAIDAYEDADRRRVFLYSMPYHTLTPQIFYRQEDASRLGFPSLTLPALQKLRGCGVFEYSYEHYGLVAAKMDLGSKNDQAMLTKLSLGRCDYALEELEYVVGGRRTEGNWPDESAISSFQPAWAKPPQLHFLIGQAHPKAQELQLQVNNVIASSEKNGFLKALRKTYF